MAEAMEAAPPKVCKLCRYAKGVCTTGFRKNHERADPQCRLHGSDSRGNTPPAREAQKPRPQPVPQVLHFERRKSTIRSPPGGATGGANLDAMTQFATRKGLHMLYPPEPLDRWIGRDIHQTQGGLPGLQHGGAPRPTGESEYEQYQQRFLKRCKLGGKADRLVRIVDRYMPRIAAENRVYTMRFPEKVHDMLLKARAINGEPSR